MSTHALANGAMQSLKCALMTCACPVILTVDLEAILPIPGVASITGNTVNEWLQESEIEHMLVRPNMQCRL